MQITMLQQIHDLRRAVDTAKCDPETGHYAIELDMLAHSDLLRTARETGMLDSFLKDRYTLGTLLLDDFQYLYLKEHLQWSEEALDRYAAIPGHAQEPIFKYFSHGTAASAGAAGGHEKLARLMQDTHMFALAAEPGSKQNHLYTTLAYRRTALEAMELLRPDIVADVKAVVQERGIDLDTIGEIPMTPKQIDEFCKSFQDVIVMLDKGEKPGSLAAQKMAAISKHSIIRRRPPQTTHTHGVLTAPRSPLVERGDDGHTKLSHQPSEESINNFLLPLEVLEPIRDTLKRLDNAQAKSDGLHEKMRRSPEVAAWVGYTDRGLMVARGLQLQQLLKMHPHLSESISCMTVYASPGDRKPIIKQQPLGYAHREPMLTKSELQSVVQHTAEYWLAVPQSLLATLHNEAEDMRTQTQDAKEMFVRALNEPDATKSATMREEADGYLQLVLNEYKERGVLGENFTTKALRTATGLPSQGRA